MSSLLSQLPTLRATRNLAILSLTAGLTALVYILLRAGDSRQLRDTLSHPWYIDTAGHAFQHPIRPGQPALTTSSAGLLAYPAELCFWTADGRPKSSPTYVLLNTYLRPGTPTYCPDCGRLVVPNNPAPNPHGLVAPPPLSATPPTTREARNAP